MTGSACGAARPFKRGVYHPGEWRRRVGFGTGTLGDMGCHIYSPPYRALKLTSPLSVTASRPVADRGELGDQGARQAHVSGHRVHRRTRRWTSGGTDGGELPPDAIREPVGARLPEQGSIVVGTDGLIVLPHTTRGAVRAAGRRRWRRCRTIDLPERDHYARVPRRRAGRAASSKCSASFDYAGPLTESVLIGNVAARFPGETLEFDGKALKFPKGAGGKSVPDPELSSGLGAEGAGVVTLSAMPPGGFTAGAATCATFMGRPQTRACRPANGPPSSRGTTRPISAPVRAAAPRPAAAPVVRPA